MKKNNTFFAVFCAVMLLAASGGARAQTLTLDSISGTSFCAGDPFSVTFTATGTWQHNNAFTLQLSNASGSFASGFQNIGSIQDTSPGTFTITSTVPTNVTYATMSISINISKHITIDTIGGTIDSTMSYDTTFDTTDGTNYRFRVTGAYPLTESADNGYGIVIGEEPTSYQWLGKEIQSIQAINFPVTFQFDFDENTFHDYNDDDTVYLNYGSGASPATQMSRAGVLSDDIVPVTYSTGGLKTIVIHGIAAGGCSVSDTFQTYVFDCTEPAIPSDAIIISSNNTKYAAGKTYWVNPGVSFQGFHDTIFAETGASISGSYNVTYLKPDAIADGNVGGVVIYAPGAGADSMRNEPTLECTDLVFDYTVAPPNSIMHINDGAGVAPTNTTPSQIEMFPNPTNGNVTLQNLPMGSNVMVMNVLGETVQTENAHSNTNLSLDLSNFTAGTYYIRIASGNSVTTKSIVKE